MLTLSSGSEGKKLLDAEMASRRAVIAKGGTPKGGKEFRLRLIGLRLSNLRDDKNVKGSGQLDGVSVSCIFVGRAQLSFPIEQWAGTKSKNKTKAKKSKSKTLPAKSEGSAPPPDLKHSSEEPLNGDMEEDNFDDEEGEKLSRSFDDFCDDDKPAVNGQIDARANQPASSDPLWAAVGDDDVSFDFADEDTPIDTTYKPFFTGGPSLNSKRHMGDGPTPMEDRLSFESKKRSTDDDDIIFIDDEVPSGPLECPVCSRSFIGSTVALSAHVASHFDDEPGQYLFLVISLGVMLTSWFITRACQEEGQGRLLVFAQAGGFLLQAFLLQGELEGAGEVRQRHVLEALVLVPPFC